ncbi:hypothetical protein D3C72_1611850 [compost metagenome]
MEHGRDRHVHIARTQQRLATAGSEGPQFIERMQHQLAMGEIHALWVAGGTGGVKQRRQRVLVEVGKLELGLRGSQQHLVLTQHRQCSGTGLGIAEADKALNRRHITLQLFQQGQEVIMHQHQAIFSMVHGVADLLGRQAHIDRVQYRANHRHGKETLQRPVAVPVKQGHGVAGFDPGLNQDIGQALNAFEQGRIAVT